MGRGRKGSGSEKRKDTIREDKGRKIKGEGREGPPVAVTETLCPVIPFPSSPLPLFFSSPSPFCFLSAF